MGGGVGRGSQVRSIKGGPRNALGHRPEPEVLPPGQQKRAARLSSAAPGSIKGGGPRNALSGTVQSLKALLAVNEPRGSQVLRLASIRGGPKRALGHRPEPEVLPPASRNEPRGSQVLRLAASRGGPPALGHRPEPASRKAASRRGPRKRARVPSREAPKCCAWQHQGKGPEERAASRNEPRGSEVLRPGSIKGGGRPETRSGTIQSLKCCPCQQKTSREAPKCCAWQHQGGGAPKRAVQSLKCCPCTAETSREAPQVLRLAASRGGGPETTSREAPKCCAWHRPEPEVLPLPAETSREAPKCCAWQPAETSREACK